MLQFFSWLVGCKTARSFCVGQEREQLNERFGARMKKESETEERRIKPFASSSSRERGLTPVLCIL